MYDTNYKKTCIRNIIYNMHNIFDEIELLKLITYKNAIDTYLYVYCRMNNLFLSMNLSVICRIYIFVLYLYYTMTKDATTPSNTTSNSLM